MSELDDRRQRAREAGLDALGGALFDGIDEAIETATRVQVTPGIEAAAYDAIDRSPYVSPEYVRPMIEAALRAAGFEVEP